MNLVFKQSGATKKYKSNFFPELPVVALSNSLTEDETLHQIKGSPSGPKHQFHSDNTAAPPNTKEKLTIFQISTIKLQTKALSSRLMEVKDIQMIGKSSKSAPHEAFPGVLKYASHA